MNQTYQRYQELEQKKADINNALALMSWDREVNMPPEGAGFRAQQMATLSGILHDVATSNEYEEVLGKLIQDDSLTFIEKRNVKESHRIFLKNKKLPKAYVEKVSKAISQAFESWLKAREENSFEVFVPKLKNIVDLKLECSELLGYKEHPYDALLDSYEPGLTVSKIDVIFRDVRNELPKFYEKIKHQQPDSSFLNADFPADKQLDLCKKIISDLGYSRTTGRLDMSAHPFSTSFNPKDSRITTRINTNELQECIWGAIHETGHAFYELGLQESQYGMPAGEAASLSIHESQSRLWENNVGKSMNFIQAYWNDFREYFPETFAHIDAEAFFKAINVVTPDFIRINSDEVTYHFHVLLRYEIEKELFEGKLKVEDLDELWNAKVKQYLDLDVPSPKYGVLQDIHWSHGSFGYFPTYSLGSFYAAQFYAHAAKAIPEIDDQIRNKNFAPLLHWLRENIHQHGRTYYSEDLCEKVTGEPLKFEYFNTYIHKKYSKIYRLE